MEPAPRKLPFRPDRRGVELSGRIGWEVRMKRSRFTESQIVEILKEADAGLPTNEVWRKHGISSATYYKWKAKYGGLEVSELVRVKELESENSRLKRMYAELALENEAIKGLLK